MDERIEKKKKKRMGKEMIKLMSRNIEYKDMRRIKNEKDNMNGIEGKRRIDWNERSNNLNRKGNKDEIKKRKRSKGIVIEKKRNGEEEK